MKQRLEEINILRPITIALLVVMHAFTLYAGNWPLPEGIQPVRAYFWVQKFSFSCMLEMFVFISGYIFGFQLFGQNREYSFGKLAINKLKRLIIPSIIFSLLYMLCFSDIIVQHEWKKLVYYTIAGYAHMWFLPMLFWCFLGGWAIAKCKINDFVVLLLLLIVSMFSHFPMPFQINIACYYLFFFYLGMCLYKHRERLTQIANEQAIGLYVSLEVFILLTVLQTRTMEIISSFSNTAIIDRILSAAQINVCKISYALFGTVLFYLLALHYTSQHTLSAFTVNINAYCFGIYIFQQFILEIIYYHSPAPQLLGTYWLPWIAFVITIVLSYALTRLMLLTHTGRFLIG